MKRTKKKNWLIIERNQVYAIATFSQLITAKDRQQQYQPLSGNQEQGSKLSRLDPKLVIMAMLSGGRRQIGCDNENLEAVQEDNYDPGNLMPPGKDDDMVFFMKKWLMSMQ